MRSGWSLSIRRLVDTDEWKVVVKKDGKLYEPASYYSSDPIDAVASLVSMAKNLRKQGEQVKILQTGTTKKAINFWLKSSDQEIELPEIKAMFGPEYKQIP